MGGCMKTLGDEFKLKQFGFAGVKTERFYYFWYWTCPAARAVYVCYRLVLAVFTLVSLAVMAASPPVPHYMWWSFMTQWSYLALCVHLALHCVLAVYLHCKAFRERRAQVNPIPINQHNARLFDDDPSDSLPWYVCVVWVTYNITCTLSLLVTVAYYSLFNQLQDSPDLASFPNVQRHAVSSLLVLLDTMLTATPCRLLHFVYPILFGVVYVVYTAVMWAERGLVVYPSYLDWRYLGRTVGYMTAVVFVVLVVHALFFLLYIAKMALYERLRQK